ncbi:MAG TPA: hypothetical protein VGX03_22115, partial [Candidatus Binatia bacterium]|nr:hypothetical protein [Candidatus Binatia bacterium]
MNEQGSRNDAESILSAAIALAPLIHECREEIERGRRLPLHLVDALKQAGVFRDIASDRAFGKESQMKLYVFPVAPNPTKVRLYLGEKTAGGT